METFAGPAAVARRGHELGRTRGNLLAGHAFPARSKGPSCPSKNWRSTLNAIQYLYIAAGLVLPLYYIPQIRRCMRDETLLSSYSMGKSGTQFVLRLSMMPFVFSVGDVTMSCIVSLDLLGRGAELFGAMFSLRRQGQSWAEIRLRAWPVLSRASRTVGKGGVDRSDGWGSALTAFGDLPKRDASDLESDPATGLAAADPAQGDR